MTKNTDITQAQADRIEESPSTNSVNTKIPLLPAHDNTAWADNGLEPTHHYTYGYFDQHDGLWAHIFPECDGSHQLQVFQGHTGSIIKMKHASAESAKKFYNNCRTILQLTPIRSSDQESQ